jgi:hypothetical protein
MTSKLQYFFICTILVMDAAIVNAQQTSNRSLYNVFQRNEEIVLSNKGEEKVISKSAGDTLPLLSGNQLYYINNPETNNTGGTIMVYDIGTGTTSDLLKNAANNSDYIFKDRIANLLPDAAKGRLYFSTMLTDEKGIKNCVTWLYDIHSKEIAAYKDGLIENIDTEGKQTIIFYGMDHKGSYTWTVIYNNNGSVNKSYTKVYMLK